MKLFPFTLYAQETEHFTSSPYDFKESFIKNKPKDMRWYAYDVVINSPTEVEFIVHGMRDVCYGGIGSIVWSFSTIVEPSVTRNAIENRARNIAKNIRGQELIEAEKKIIDSYTNTILLDEGLEVISSQK